MKKSSLSVCVVIVGMIALHAADAQYYGQYQATATSTANETFASTTFQIDTTTSSVGAWLYTNFASTCTNSGTTSTANYSFFVAGNTRNSYYYCIPTGSFSGIGWHQFIANPINQSVASDQGNFTTQLGFYGLPGTFYGFIGPVLGANRFITTVQFGGSDPTNVRQDFYAKIQNTETLSLHDGSSTSASVLKALPADWVIHVVSTTDLAGNPIIADGYRWYKVIDVQDGINTIVGWMAATSSSATYLSYDASSQSDFQTKASTQLTTPVDRATVIKSAVDWYYINTSSTGSLYSSSNLSSAFSSSTPLTTYPEDLVFPIVAQESGGINFNNEYVSFDYGHGVMQLTNRPTSSEVYYLQVLLNNDPDTIVSSSTGADGSPGFETHHFGGITESAVQRFQIKYSADPVVTTACNPLPTSTLGGGFGQVGYCTRIKLNDVLSSWSTSTIPSAFSFKEHLSTTINSDDLLSPDATSTGILSGLRMPPCDERQDLSSPNYMKNCYQALSSSTEAKSYISQTFYGNQIFKYYTNTSQSIYANIKDGLSILKGKYDTCFATSTGFCHPTVSTSTLDGETFTYNEKRDVLATWGFNGFASTTYLGDVANKLASINSYFSTIPNPATSTGSWVNKLRVAQNHKFEFWTLSPVEVRVINSHGRTTGLVNGRIKSEIPDSAYNPKTGFGVVLFPNDTFTYKILGKADDTYSFIVHSNDGSATSTIFEAVNIPISRGSVHEYLIDFNKIVQGKQGAVLRIDDRGNGVFNRTITNIGKIYYESPSPDMIPRFAPPKPIVVPPAPNSSPPPMYLPQAASTSSMNPPSSTIKINSSTTPNK